MQVFKRIVKKNFPQPAAKCIGLIYRKARFTICCCQTAFFRAKITCRKKSAAKCVVFLIGVPEVWNSLKSVYEAALARTDIRAYVIALPKLHDSVTGTKALDNPAYDFLRRHEVKNLISAYDEATREWFDPRTLHPDYAVYTRPYLNEYNSLYSPKYVRAYAKVCLIPYAYNMLENKFSKIVFNDRFISNCSMIFFASESRRAQCARTFALPCKMGTLKLFYRGFPRFDLLRQQPYGAEGREKPVKNLHVLWLPRWTTEEDSKDEASHFLRYNAEFLAFFEKHTSMDLMIRPHPKMFDNLVKRKKMTEDDVARFIKACETIPNVRLDRDEDYLTAFAWSDILVADYSSLLMEYYCSGKPIILCERSQNLSVEGMRMQDTLEVAGSWGEIESMLLRFCGGSAPKQRDRADVLRMVLAQSETNIGATILTCILEN